MDLRAATLAVDKGGSSFPGGLVAFYGQAKGAFTDVVAWNEGAALVVQFTPTVASGDVVGDVLILGPLYMRAGYLVANDGVSDPPALCATTWADGDTITVRIETDTDNTMRIGRV